MEKKIEVCGPTGIFLISGMKKFLINGIEVSEEEYGDL